MKLYELANDYQRALIELPESGFDEQTIADTLEGLEGALTIKAQNVAAYVLNLEAEIEAVKAVAKRISERAEILENRAKSLRNYLYVNMKRSGISEIKANDGSFTAKIRMNPPAVEIVPDVILPTEFIRLIPARTEPDKAKLKASSATIAVQVNGKVRGTITVDLSASESEVLAAAKLEAGKWIEGKTEHKALYVPGKIVTLVVS